MPRVCTVCCHADRAAIDSDLLAGVPNRRIATQRVVSEAAVRRHKAEHLPAHLARAHEAEQAADATNLLAQMQALLVKALGFQDRAEKAGDLRTALLANREARANLELVAEMLGKLSHQPTVNVLVSTEWVTVRSALLDALLPFPEARTAVSARLLALGDGRAT